MILLFPGILQTKIGGKKNERTNTLELAASIYKPMCQLCTNINSKNIEVGTLNFKGNIH